ncbi:E3 ubiquitin-protein ligase synoviolin B [Octopus sinensis]|uniref:RING-type E3 ubiquitin transferase n=1 Tax=Octopus sinensis TaxID=2607531 RepID=A0A6P7TFE9_9MOLL|nr:E3 ubiquitin-protein ligase synoviolin B [Octopus sinensis]
MRAFMLTGFSFLLTTVVIANAYYQKSQFYPSVVYITKSNGSMAILYIQAFVFVVLMGKLMRKIFFGQLRAAEMEHLIERSWYAVTETCLAFTVFRDDFNPRFVAMFTLLLFLKCFHWLAEDRVDYMERSPMITIRFHIRVMSLIIALASVDLHFINHAYYSTLLRGASVQLVFGFEYAILLTVVLMTLTKYILHAFDLQSENPWENKAVYLLYTELIMGLIKVLLYVLFMVIVIKVHTFPLFTIRPMYLSVRAFKKALNDIVMSRRAIRNMNTLYPDATPEELSSGDNVCIICREEMVTACKKLPCNHIFHASCLRSWFQRQQTCPTCRMDILRIPRPQPAQPQQAQPQQNVPQPPLQPPHPQFPHNMVFPGFPPMPLWAPNMPPPPPPPPAQTASQQQTVNPVSTQNTSNTTTTSNSTTTTTTTATTTTATAEPSMSVPESQGYPGTSQNNMSFLSFPPLFSSFVLQNQSVLSGLSTEELASLEGQERCNIEARIQWLRDIQTLLDGAMVLMNQYNQVAAHSGIQGISMLPRNVDQPNTSSHTKDHSVSQNQLSNNESAEKPNENTPNKSEDLDYLDLEGATGETPKKSSSSPEAELRRRRLQHFISQSNETK